MQLYGETMNLSPHFTLEELAFSQTAIHNGLDNSPPPVIQKNLKRVAETLEQVRALVGKPVSVSSGYRSPAVNRAVGGAGKSAHVSGLAADINCPGVTPKQLANAIKASGIAFDQLIYEGTWVHIGLSDGTPRQQVLTAVFDNGKASYQVGIA
jgi:hypothetical protein